MIRIPTRTMFQLLTASIGLMIVALLGLVGLMLYSAFARQEPATVNVPAPPPVAPAAWRSDSALNSSNALHKLLHPPVEVKPQDNWGGAVANHGGYRFLGGVNSDGGAQYVWLQNERTRDPVQLIVGREKNGMKAVSIDLAKNEAAVMIGGQTKLMSRQESLVAPVAAAGRPGGNINRNNPAVRNMPATTSTGSSAPAGNIQVISNGRNVSSSGNSAVNSNQTTAEQRRAALLERIRRQRQATPTGQ